MLREVMDALSVPELLPFTLVCHAYSKITREYLSRRATFSNLSQYVGHVQKKKIKNNNNKNNIKYSFIIITVIFLFNNYFKVTNLFIFIMFFYC